MEDLQNYLSTQMLLNANTSINSLSKSQLKVHNYIMANADQIIYTSLAQLSELVEVGEATILRYCQKLGFLGYTNFKIELLKLVTNTNVIEYTKYIDQITMNMIEAINQTKNGVDEASLEKACEYMANAKEIILIGEGLSYNTASDTYSRLIRIGFPATIVPNAHFLYMKSSLVSEKDSVICYSFSGETYEVIKTAKICKQYGAKIIAITNYASSEISKLADVTLITHGIEKNLSGGSFSNKVSQYYISDLLVTKLSLMNVDKAKEAIEKTTRTVMNLEE